MPIFACEKCRCAENTALGEYWGRDKKLCSECATGKWHGQFEKQTAIGWLIDNHGYLWKQDKADLGYLPKNFRIVGVVKS